jgi:hypothetical protein
MLVGVVWCGTVVTVDGTDSLMFTCQSETTVEHLFALALGRRTP